MIYLDYAAATPMHPQVLEAMLPYMKGVFGNASSIHQYGQAARKAVDEARNKVIELIGAFSVHEIIFTGSGTESCNMAIFGAAFARAKREPGKSPGNIVVSAIEHPAVLEPARYLRDNFGFTLTEVLPDEEGIVQSEALAAAIQEDTLLISVMLANNEIGTLQPIKKIAKLARERGILMHTDACQAPGYADIHVEHLGVDMLTLNGSKIYGPKGSGLLYVREGVKITPLLHGGGQEFRMRGGTENVANIVGFATALEWTLTKSKEEATRIATMRDDLLETLLSIQPSAENGLTGPITLNGSKEKRLANNINISTPGISGETLMMKLDMEGLAASSGSACSSGKTEPSSVLQALGQSPEQASQSLRITLGRPTDQKDIEAAKAILKKVLGD